MNELEQQIYNAVINSEPFVEMLYSMDVDTLYRLVNKREHTPEAKEYSL